MLANHKRNKLDYKLLAYVFIGYPQQHDGYLCYSPKESKIYISKNVRFIVYDFTLNKELCQEKILETDHTDRMTDLYEIQTQINERNSQDLLGTGEREADHDPASIQEDWKIESEIQILDNCQPEDREEADERTDQQPIDTRSLDENCRRKKDRSQEHTEAYLNPI